VEHFVVVEHSVVDVYCQVQLAHFVDVMEFDVQLMMNQFFDCDELVHFAVADNFVAFAVDVVELDSKLEDVDCSVDIVVAEQEEVVGDFVDLEEVHDIVVVAADNLVVDFDNVEVEEHYCHDIEESH
jgi:hypothetical protein